MVGSILFTVYVYIGYPFILWVIGRFSKKAESPDVSYPSVTVLLSAHNEDAIIGRTLDSIFQCEYPNDLLDVIVVSDGSTDRTDEIVNSFNNNHVKLLSFNQRRGKNVALAGAYQQAVGDILIVVDASSIFRSDSIKKLVRHFSDPKIGSVVGSKVILDTGSSVSRGDGLYWKYESMIRSLESAIGSSWVGVEGGFFAIRKALLQMDFGPDLASDYAICCNVYEQGYRNRYDRSAIVYEPPTSGMDKEFLRKVRVIVRGIRAFFVYKNLLNPFKHPGFSFQNISHRLCRWLVPFFLISLYLSSALGASSASQLLFYIQTVFYLAAIAGICLKPLRVKPWLTSIPLYFTTMNAAALISWFLLWYRFDIWKPTERESAATSSAGSSRGLN